MFNRITYVCFGVILMGSALFMSCQSTSPIKQIDSGKSQIINSKNQVGNSADVLTTTTKTITDNTNDIIAKTPEPTKSQIQPNTTAILQQTAVQDTVVKDLRDVQQRLVDAEKKATTLEGQYSTERDNRIKAEQDATKQLKAKYISVSVLCFAGAIICGVLVCTGNVWAKTGALVCSAGCAASIFLVQTVGMIPWIVGGIIVIAAGMYGWQFYQKHKTIAAQSDKIKENTGTIAKLNVATKHLVETVEGTKPLMTEMGRKAYFGDGPLPGLVRTIQDDNTMSIVKKYRAELNNLAPKIDETIAIDVNGDGVIDEKDKFIFPTDTSAPDTIKSGPQKIGGPRSRIILK